MVSQHVVGLYRRAMARDLMLPVRCTARATARVPSTVPSLLSAFQAARQQYTYGRVESSQALIMRRKRASSSGLIPFTGWAMAGEQPLAGMRSLLGEGNF